MKHCKNNDNNLENIIYISVRCPYHIAPTCRVGHKNGIRCILVVNIREHILLFTQRSKEAV